MRRRGSPAGGREDPETERLLDHIRRGDHMLTVSARDRFAKERARRILQQLGATETIDLDQGDEGVAFARAFADVEPQLREHSARTYGADAWETMLPAYLFGWDRANRPDHVGREWDDAESELEAEWRRRQPRRSWETDGHAVAAAWSAARHTQSGQVN